MPSFEDTINSLIASFRQKIQGGITWPEFLSLLMEFIAACMAAAQHLSQDGVVKKELVLAAVGKAFDVVAPRVPIPGPPWLVAILEPIRPLLRPIIRAVVLKSADGILEGVFRLSFRPKPAA